MEEDSHSLRVGCGILYDPKKGGGLDYTSVKPHYM